MKFDSEVTIVAAMRASAAAGPLEYSGGGPRLALAWLDDVARAQPEHRPAIDAGLQALATGENTVEHAIVVDFFAHGVVAHWFWPAASAILAVSPDIASSTPRIHQPDAPILRLAELAPQLESRFQAMQARKVLLWTELPKPTLITARFIGDVLEPLQTAADGSGLRSLTWLSAAATSTSWLGHWLRWLTDQVPGSNQATALAPLLTVPASADGATPPPTYSRQGVDEADRGTLRYGGHTLRSVADLRTAVDKCIALAKARRRGGYDVPRPLGWLHRLLAAHPPWRPLVDVALHRLVTRDDGGVAWLIEWSLQTNGQLVHTPKTAAALQEIALADAEFIAAAFQESSERASALHAEAPTDRSPVSELDHAREQVRQALYQANKRPFVDTLEQILANDAPWLSLDAGIPGLAICLADLAAQLIDEGLLQRAQAPKVSAAPW